jgi:hypothetical protein
MSVYRCPRPECGSSIRVPWSVNPTEPDQTDWLATVQRCVEPPASSTILVGLSWLGCCPASVDRDPGEGGSFTPLTPLRKKQSSDHSAWMLGDSVVIKDGVLGTHSPLTTSDLML